MAADFLGADFFAAFFGADFLAGNLAMYNFVAVSGAFLYVYGISNKFKIFALMETLFVGQNQHFLRQVDSTNTYATGLLMNVNTPEGTLVFTDHQTQGRGQRGNSWSADAASNITASIILKPSFLPLQKTFYISKITALAVHDVLTENPATGQFDIKIKWPNDILAKGRKIAGILIENQLQGSAIGHSVVGIGLNVNQEGFGALSGIATSMALLSGQPFDRMAVLERLCMALEKWYLRLKQGKYEQVNEAYFAALYGYRQHLSFEEPSGQVIEGLLNTVQENGLLEVLLPDGSARLYDIKEVKLLL